MATTTNSATVTGQDNGAATLCVEKSGRGRPRDVEKNIAILEAASDLFLEKGFDATSMDQVAKRAGVSKQTVYSHFAGKEALFTNSIRTMIETHSARDALAQVEQHTLEADLFAVCEMYGRLVLGPLSIKMFRLLVSGADKNNQLSHKFWEVGPAMMLEDLTAFLKTYVDSGELDIPDLLEGAETLFSLLKGRVHFKLSIGLIDGISEPDFKLHLERCVDNFLKIYKKQA